MSLSVTDANKLFSKWPSRTTVWSPPRGRGYWLRARPKLADAPCPILKYPGTDDFTTEPDCLYAYLLPDAFADVMCIEVCNTLTNLADKRSRFMPSTLGLQLSCRRLWLVEAIRVQKGGEIPRWAATGTFEEEPTADILLPIRHLRVLYALPAKEYQECLNAEIAAPHEFYCRQSSLSPFDSKQFSDFLKPMSVKAHYLTVNKAKG